MVRPSEYNYVGNRRLLVLAALGAILQAATIGAQRCPGVEVVSRSGWGARAPRNRLAMKNPAQYVFIHHTTGSQCKDKASCCRIIRGHQNYHMDKRGGWYYRMVRHRLQLPRGRRRTCLRGPRLGYSRSAHPRIQRQRHRHLFRRRFHEVDAQPRDAQRGQKPHRLRCPNGQNQSEVLFARTPGRRLHCMSGRPTVRRHQEVDPLWRETQENHVLAARQAAVKC